MCVCVVEMALVSYMEGWEQALSYAELREMLLAILQQVGKSLREAENPVSPGLPLNIWDIDPLIENS